MPRINVEEAWFSDPRRDRLRDLVGNAVDTVAISMWRLGQSRLGELVPAEIFEMTYGWHEFELSGLAERRNGGIYIKGSDKRFEWLEKCRKAGAKGGQARGKGTLRDGLPSVSVSDSVSVSRKKEYKSQPSVSTGTFFDYETELWNLDNKEVSRWEKTYKNVDVQYQLGKMAEWLLAHPTRRKKNFAKFITNWLAKTQEDMPQHNWPKGPPKVTA